MEIREVIVVHGPTPSKLARALRDAAVYVRTGRCPRLYVVDRRSDAHSTTYAVFSSLADLRADYLGEACTYGLVRVYWDGPLDNGPAKSDMAARTALARRVWTPKSR